MYPGDPSGSAANAFIEKSNIRRIETPQSISAAAYATTFYRKIQHKKD